MIQRGEPFMFTYLKSNVFIFVIPSKMVLYNYKGFSYIRAYGLLMIN